MGPGRQAAGQTGEEEEGALGGQEGEVQDEAAARRGLRGQGCPLGERAKGSGRSWPWLWGCGLGGMVEDWGALGRML